MRYGFPEGAVYFRGTGEAYGDVAKRVQPGIIVEDDCENFGARAKENIVSLNLPPELKGKVKSVIVPEFGGLDQLPDDFSRM